MPKAKTPKMIQVTLVRSPIGFEQSQKDTVKALGLRKLNRRWKRKIRRRSGNAQQGLPSGSCRRIELSKTNED